MLKGTKIACLGCGAKDHRRRAMISLIAGLIVNGAELDKVGALVSLVKSFNASAKG